MYAITLHNDVNHNLLNIHAVLPWYNCLQQQAKPIRAR
jgi:hypothetical protein